MTHTERVEAKVAQILTDRELVLNKGADAGVEVGMRFAVLLPAGTDIRDPDSGEVLDSVEIAKTYVTVVSVTPRLAVARTFRTVQGTRSAFDVLAQSSLFGTRDRTETLRTDEKRVTQELPEAQSFVKIGDPAVQVHNDSIPSLGQDQFSD